jgi:hypothetical protein
LLQGSGKVLSTSRPGLGRKDGEEGEAETPGGPAQAAADTVEAPALDTEAKRQITPDIIKVKSVVKIKIL